MCIHTVSEKLSPKLIYTLAMVLGDATVVPRPTIERENTIALVVRRDHRNTSEVSIAGIHEIKSINSSSTHRLRFI